jgi:hypothetical protein
MNLLRQFLNIASREEGHAYAWGGGGLLTLLLIVVILIIIF